MADEQQPDDDEFPKYDDDRRGSVELHDESLEQQPEPEELPPSQMEAETIVASPKAQPIQKKNKSLTNSPKRLGMQGGGSLFGNNKSKNSALILTGVGSSVGGPRGFEAIDDIDANINNGKPKRRQRGKHDRVATDTNALSNADFLKEINKDLPQEEVIHHKKKSNELKYERELKHALMKLSESEEQRETAVEIIGNLEHENEDLKQENDRVRNELSAALTECQILEKSYRTLQETYTHDKREFEENIRENEQKLKELQDDIQDKNLALQEAEQGIRQRDESIGEFYRLQSLESTDSSTIAMGINTDKEKKLYEKYHNEKRKVIEKDQTINQLLQKLESNTRMEAEVGRLQDELERVQLESQEALMNQALSQKAMESELIALASRNSQFQKEKEELERLLEEVRMESNQLREHVVRGRTMTNRNLLQRDNSNLANDNNNLESMGMGQGSFISDEYGYDDEDYYEEDEQQPHETSEEQKDTKFEEVTQPIVSVQSSKLPIKKEKEVPDVVKEYLHLTASAVKIKHPKVTTIDSEELIKRVSQFSFWEYHDHMVRIMKNEEKKIEQKLAQEEQNKKLKAMQERQQQQANQQSSGILGKFRKFWGGGSSSSSSNTNNNSNNNSTRQATQSVAHKSKSDKLNVEQRQQSQSVNPPSYKNPKIKSGKPRSKSPRGQIDANGNVKKSSKHSKDSKHHKDNVPSKVNENDNNNNNNNNNNGNSTTDNNDDSKTETTNTNDSNNISNGSHSNNNNNNNGKRSSKKAKSPVPAASERIENALSKAAQSMGLSSPQHKPKEDIEEMAQQEFKSIAPIAASEDEADDGNAVL